MKKLTLTMFLFVISTSTAWAGPYEDGVVAYKKSDYATAIRLFQPIAAQGNGPAQDRLGDMYHDGEGVPQDYVQALKWYKLAAAQGVAYSQLSLGNMYFAGEGVPQDYAEATKWFKLAAAQKFALAQFRLGLLYLEGRGLAQDSVRGHMWLTFAAENGHTFSKEMLPSMARRMTPQQIVEARKMAQECQAKYFKGCD